MSESTERPARRRAPPEQRRAEILEAALGCFSERGFHATTMDQLVAASGLSKGSLYWHFDSKEDVFLGLFDWIASDIFERVDAAAASGEADVASLLRREIEIFFERFGEERRLVLAWMEFLTHPRARERMAEIYRVLRTKMAGLIRTGVEAGQLRPVSPEGAAATITGMIDSLILQAAIDPDFDIRAHMDALWDVVHGGIAPVAGVDASRGPGGREPQLPKRGD
jgi:AcrR family transcriptional regulator